METTTIDIQALKKELVLDLIQIGALKFGRFTLKSGIVSPFYVDLRIIGPKMLRQFSVLLYHVMTVKGLTNMEKRVICGVPYSALTFSSCMSMTYDLPMVICRKERKQYGTGNMVEGIYTKNETNCILIEDVITSGASIVETAEKLENEGLLVTDALVFLTREQLPLTNGMHILKKGEKVYNVHPCLTMTEVTQVLLDEGKMSQEQREDILQFIGTNTFSETKTTAVPQKKKELTFTERAELTNNEFSKKLFKLMEEKQTNLCVAADITSKDDLLKLADETGPEICMLKTHIDTLDDQPDEQFTQQLKELAKKHNFLIFEDRKLADIGQVVKQQYARGPFKIAQWSDLCNSHLVSGGSATVKALKESLKEENITEPRGLLLIAQMSTEGATTGESTKQEALKVALENPDFVSGFICQSKLRDDLDQFLYCTPGVRLDVKGDSLGQQYNSPEYVVCEKKCDVIIVGRGIYHDKERQNAAKLYRKLGWEAYQKRIQQ
uniref:Uridine 5'-monophosphate synthase n=1 Tax=Naegleria gruberi TaxID=5762 RepID=UMPS_NAEGR|nr:RecName: Full=Uridine 5'-monophosphate synthase; Short=UMP synthase; Includes: RecName: Full=Orotate phosphoribosyltransferase; Short=OPRTase; Includes: RecName: Full=Orotidine 5'-phosphate decarboxylase; AltName: Full=OMPdecase [Naegleria gruberi]AAA29385.1 OMP synthase [Naegleria gruberi]